MPSLKANLYKHWPLYAAAGIFVLFVIIISALSIRANNGQLVYSLDDAYIHMALAKNLSQHCVWGVTKYGFTSSSSSLLWTSLIALVYFVFGLNESAPFILNLISALLIIFSSYFIFRKNGVSSIVSFLFLLLLIFITPMLPLMFTGLEHVMHILVSLLFVYYASEIISGLKKSRKHFLMLLLLSMCLPALRYEGLVLILVASCLLLIKKKWLLSVLILIAGIFPIFVFGIISVSKGWSFFPNSLVMKADIADVMSLGEFIKLLVYQLSRLFTPSNAVMLILVLIFLFTGYYYYRKIRTNISAVYKRNAVMVFLLLVNVVLYYFYSKTGWSYRYQSFLVAMAVFIIPIIFFGIREKSVNPLSLWNKTPVRILGYLALAAGFVYQGAGAYETTLITPLSTTNIYQQQYQMAHFIKRFYEGKEVALNDIGTTSYFADIKLVDLWGLADIDVSKMRRKKIYYKNEIRNVAKTTHLKIAIIYDSWFVDDGESIIPDEWIKVGEWKISNNIAAADDAVLIYAVDPSEESNLIINLKAYSPAMPPQVIQSGKYMTK